MQRPPRARPLDPPSDATTPETEPATDETLESEACPLHTVLGELAQTAVRQHVLHLEGEVLPRADLVDELEGWQQLYHLVRTRLCPATRTVPGPPADLTSAVDLAVVGLLPPSVPDPVQKRLRRQLLACAACTSPAQCPLGLPASGQRSRGVGEVMH